LTPFAVASDSIDYLIIIHHDWLDPRQTFKVGGIDSQNLAKLAQLSKTAMSDQLMRIERSYTNRESIVADLEVGVRLLSRARSNNGGQFGNDMKVENANSALRYT
jgi:hypothetical protein